MSRRPDPLDIELLQSFAFECRPDCGLCCFTEPAVTGSERTRLLQIEPEAPLEGVSERYSVIRARPDGGACHFLAKRRCRVHAERPFVCRSFPIIVHLGPRAQASLVLSCPGLTLGLETRARRPSALGLGPELESVRSALAREDLPDWKGFWIEEVEGLGLPASDRVLALEPSQLQRRLAAAAPVPSRADLDLGGLPDLEDGWENLPGVFQEGQGVVAIGEREGLWEAYTLSESGDGPRSLGSFLPPSEPPRLDSEGTRLLQAYAAYLARRDQTLGQLLADPDGLADGLEAALAGEIRRAGADVVLRGAFLAQLNGRPSGTLGAVDVEAGIRATDMDRLDRPTIGAIL